MSRCILGETKETTDCSRKAEPPEHKVHEWHFEWSSLPPVHQNVSEWLLKAVSSLEKCHIKYKTMKLGGEKGQCSH